MLRVPHGSELLVTHTHIGIVVVGGIEQLPMFLVMIVDAIVRFESVVREEKQ
jgi:hypothetical protein